MLLAMSHRLVVLLLAAGCGGHVQPGPVAPPPPDPGTRITASSIGPLTAATPATLVGLRAQLPGLDIVPVNRLEGLEYEVRQGKDVLYYVIPDENAKILNVHVTNAKFTVADHNWGIGKELAPGDATLCECWGDKPVCYKKGDHVAAAFDRQCDEYEENLRSKVAKLAVVRVVWSPRGFEEGGYGGDEYGGDPCGGDPDPCGGD